jgi:hypothetical protein
MSADPHLDALLHDVARALDEDLLADPGCPDFAAVVARAHELDPRQVTAEQVAEVAQWAPVVSIGHGHRRRRTRDDLALLTVIEGVRAHVDEEVARHLGTPPPPPRATAPSSSPRRVWMLVLAAAAVLLVVGASALRGGMGRLDHDEPTRNEAVLLGPTSTEEPTPRTIAVEPSPAPETPALEPEPPALEPEPPALEPEPAPEPEPLARAKAPRSPTSNPSPPTLEELDAAAHASWRAGDLAKAEQLFRRLAKRAGDDRLGDLAYGDLFTLARQTRSPAKEAALWREYLERFPRGRFADDARGGLCRRADGAAQVECWQRYLEDRPDGAHRAQAQRALASAGVDP